MKRKQNLHDAKVRAVAYLVKNPSASARDVAGFSGCSLYTARKLIEQRQTPVKVLTSPSPTEGRKDDHGKLPWHLLPPDAIEEILKVLKFGAKKYSTVAENEWHALLLVPTVTHVLVRTPTGSVVRVTKDILGEPTLSLLNGSDKTDAIGSDGILIKCESWQSVDRLIRQYVKETHELSGSSDYVSSDLPKSGTKNSAKRGAQYAVKNNTCALTIAMQQDNFAVSFAPDAITDLGFWTIVWKDLNAHFGISRPQSQTGERNWEKGMAWSRPFAALMRHMWAWWRGEDCDPETGFTHLAHAACCILFLLAYEKRNIGTDDRPHGNNQTTNP